MIVRKNYRASLLTKENSGRVAQELVQQALELDSKVVREAIAAGRCLTVAMYQHEDMLFLYLEALEEALQPDMLFPHLSKLLALWPEKDGLAAWASMYTIYYHDIPMKEEDWARTEKKKRRGRIAYLHEDKLFSYVYYHKAIVDEGLLEGDRYQFIALHENILFSYFEEPKIFTHIKKDSQEESKVIQDWLAVDPESHFDHTLSGEENFLFLPELFSMGKEDNMENP